MAIVFLPTDSNFVISYFTNITLFSLVQPGAKKLSPYFLPFIIRPNTPIAVTYATAFFGLSVKDFSQKNKKSVLFSSHNLNSASYFAEKAVLISEFQQNENRQIFLEGKCSEIFTSEILSSVYGGKISVFYHPISGKPIIE